MLNFFADYKDWSCTDPDNFQYCKVINKNTFAYMQVRDYLPAFHTLDKLFPSGCNEDCKKYIFENLNSSDVWYEEICLEDYPDWEIEDALSAYGGILDGWKKEIDRNQIIAECLFELNAE